MTDRTSLPNPPDTDGPFTRRAAVMAGLSDEVLAGPQFRRLFRGVHASRSLPVTLSLRARAAIVVAPPGSVISHHTAARLWGGTVPDTSLIHVTVPGRRSFTRDGVSTHRPSEMPPWVRRRGVPLTDPARTFLDLARHLGLVDLVVLGESLVRAGAIDVETLARQAATAMGRSTGLARQATGLVRAGVDSPPETRLRLLIVMAGLPEPTVDHRAYSEHGRLLYRFDLAVEHVKLAIEYDGAHHNQPRQRGPDLLRREQLEALGWTFVVVVNSHLSEQPGEVIARTARAMRRLGLRVPARLSEQWRPYFSAREPAR